MKVSSTGEFTINIYTGSERPHQVVFGTVKSGTSEYVLDGEQSKQVLELVNRLALYSRPEIKMAPLGNSEEEEED